jgi:ribonuclease P protein component
LRRREDFERLLATGGTANRWFVVYAQKSEIGVSRLGVIAGKRIMPTAVARNYAKRLVKEAFRLDFPAEHSSLDVVVRVRVQLSPETSKEGRLALQQLFRALQK